MYHVNKEPKFKRNTSKLTAVVTTGLSSQLSSRHWLNTQLEGVNRGMKIPRSLFFFFAKSVDPPIFLLKSETTTTSGKYKSAKVNLWMWISVIANFKPANSKLGNMLDDYELRSRREIIWMNSLEYRPWLKKDLWSKFRSGPKVWSKNPESARNLRSGVLIHVPLSFQNPWIRLIYPKIHNPSIRKTYSAAPT